jgi:hypothetical protein
VPCCSSATRIRCLVRSAYRPQFASAPVTCPLCFRKVVLIRGKFAQHWPTREEKGRPCRRTLKAVPK